MQASNKSELNALTSSLLNKSLIASNEKYSLYIGKWSKQTSYRFWLEDKKDLQLDSIGETFSTKREILASAKEYALQDYFVVADLVSNLPQIRIQLIDINVREWFQKSYGNTYFSGEILVNHKVAASINFKYGDCNHGINCLVKEAIKNGILPPNKTGSNCGLTYLKTICTDDQLIIDTCEVCRKCDL